jgi:hypothetical protein
VPFEEYEVVRVRTTAATVAAGIAGLEGAVRGTAIEDDGEIVSYAVAIYERDGICWSVAPSDLEATGRHDRRESFYDGTSIRVSKDGECRLRCRVWRAVRQPVSVGSCAWR